jgi:sugar lactone lactonase YvrE
LSFLRFGSPSATRSELIRPWPREILSYADTSPDSPRDQLVSLSKQSGLDRKYPVVVDNELAWPMVWYLRDYEPQWASSTMSPPVTGSIVILKTGHESWMEPYLDQYQAPVSIRHLWWFGDGPQFYQGVNLGDFAKSLFDKGDWNVWRNYFVWRQVPWAPPPNDVLVYLPNTIAVEGGTALTPPPSIPTVTIGAADQAIIGAGKLNEPTDVTLDAGGNIYVSDGKSNSIQIFSSDGALLRTLQPSGDDACRAVVGRRGVDGIYVSDTWHFEANGRVAKYDANLNLVWATKQDMGLYGPRDLIMLPDGNLLVADTGNKRIIELSSSTGDIVDTHGGDGSGPGQFNEPVGLAIGPNGDIYVADTWNGRVQHFDSTFKYLGEFTVKGWGSKEVTAKPYLAVLSDGRVIVGNPANGRIELYNQQGKPLVAWELPAASTGAKGRPVGMAMDAGALLYVADCAGNQVYRLPVASLTGP